MGENRKDKPKFCQREVQLLFGNKMAKLATDKDGKEFRMQMKSSCLKIKFINHRKFIKFIK